MRRANVLPQRVVFLGIFGWNNWKQPSSNALSTKNHHTIHFVWHSSNIIVDVDGFFFFDMDWVWLFPGHFSLHVRHVRPRGTSRRVVGQKSFLLQWRGLSRRRRWTWHDVMVTIGPPKWCKEFHLKYQLHCKWYLRKSFKNWGTGNLSNFWLCWGGVIFLQNFTPDGCWF